MSLKSEAIKIKKKIMENQFLISLLIIGLIFLIKNGTIPSEFSVQSFSVLGGGLTSLSIGIIIIITGVVAAATGIGLPLGFLMIVGGILTLTGGLITSLSQVFESIVGWIIVGAMIFVFYLFKK